MLNELKLTSMSKPVNKIDIKTAIKLCAWYANIFFHVWITFDKNEKSFKLHASYYDFKWPIKSVNIFRIRVQ